MKPHTVLLALVCALLFTVGSPARADDPPPPEDPITTVEILVAPEASLTMESSLDGDIESQ